MKVFIITVIIAVIFFSLVIWSSIGLWNQSQKDWAILQELEDKVNKVKTKEEIEQLHKELVEKCNKINNPLITPRLIRIDAYLRGLYKQYQK